MAGVTGIYAAGPNGEHLGPYSADALCDEIIAGRMPESVLVWWEGAAGWVAAPHRAESRTAPDRTALRPARPLAPVEPPPAPFAPVQPTAPTPVAEPEPAAPQPEPQPVAVAPAPAPAPEPEPAPAPTPAPAPAPRPSQPPHRPPSPLLRPSRSRSPTTTSWTRSSPASCSRAGTTTSRSRRRTRTDEVVDRSVGHVDRRQRVRAHRPHQRRREPLHPLRGTQQPGADQPRPHPSHRRPGGGEGARSSGRVSSSATANPSPTSTAYGRD